MPAGAYHTVLAIYLDANHPDWFKYKLWWRVLFLPSIQEDGEIPELIQMVGKAHIGIDPTTNCYRPKGQQLWVTYNLNKNNEEVDDYGNVIS
jgi:hypothetical protein